jgi:hypothetical protein
LFRILQIEKSSFPQRKDKLNLQKQATTNAKAVSRSLIWLELCDRRERAAGSSPSSPHHSPLHILIIASFLRSSFLLRALPRHTSRAALAVRRVQGKVDVLLRVCSHHERRHVDKLLADADVALSDENTGVVD